MACWTLFLCAFYRRIYERSLIAADSLSLFMLNVQLSTLETAESRHSRLRILGQCALA